MRYLYVGILSVFTIVQISAQNESSVLQDMRVDLVYLSSDYLQGRNTGSPQEKMAANYIIQRFKEIGLNPMGESGTWLQRFEFEYNANPHSEEAGKKIGGRNVLGYIDSGAEHTVIIGAHYDHIGSGAVGSRHTGSPEIHNGADDNASGVTSLFYIADYLKNRSKAKANNYLFIAFSGEEYGLYGSKYFVGDPTIDLTKVTYMLNMDMVGRLNQERELIVNGVGTSPVWKNILDQIEVGELSLTTTESGIGASDHTSFYLKDIPVLHFFTGLHQQYHKPGDDAPLINFEGMFSVSKFIIALIEMLDDQDKLAFTKTKDEAQRTAAAFKVTLGVMPDYTFSGEGMRVDAVLDDRPAAKAGMEGGDIIIKIGDKEVKNIYDYMEGLALFKIGDQTQIVVKRGEDELIKAIKFE